MLGAHGLAELVPTAELVAAELLADAHVHTAGPYALRLRAAEDGRLRVGVWDTDPRVPPGFGDGVPLDVPPDEAENGRGLPLVRTCASSWGVGALTGGKVLWAECGWRRASCPTWHRCSRSSRDRTGEGRAPLC